MSFTISFLIWTATATLYIITDQLSIWIHHPYYEFRVWILLLSLLINIFLFYFTRLLSGYNLSENKTQTLLFSFIFSITISILIVPIVSTFLVNNWLRNRLQKFQFLKARKDLEFSLNYKNKTLNKDENLLTLKKNHEIKKKAREINFFLKLISQSPFSSSKKKRNEIFNILKSASSNDLNTLLMSVNLPQLFTYGLYFSKELKISTVEYIIESRVNDLNIITKASLIHALMRTSTLSFSKLQSNFTLKSFKTCLGRELTLFKNLLDSSGDYNNLYKLVFIDIQNKKQRKNIITHMFKQGRKVLSTDNELKKKKIKILSDVDDTLYSSGGRFPAGSDIRIPRHEVYPGILQLFEEIDVFTHSHGLKNNKKKNEASFGADEEEVDSEFELFLKKDKFVETKIEKISEAMTIVGKSNYSLKIKDNEKKQKFKITLKLPWKLSDEEEEIICNQDTNLNEIFSNIEEKYSVPIWKINIKIESFDDEERSIEIEGGEEEVDGEIDFKHGNVTFLSARPNVYKDISERTSYTIFQRLLTEGVLHTTPTMLTGSLSSGLKAMFLRYKDNLLFKINQVYEYLIKILKNKHHNKQALDFVEKKKILITNKNWRAVGMTKVDKFKKYSILYPEYKFIFFGDDGQGDVYAAEKLMKYFSKYQNYPKRRLIKCFMHRCKIKNKNSQSLVLSSLSRDNATEENWAKMGILFFDTYVGAAIDCYKIGLISAKGLWRVADRSFDEMMKLMEGYPNFDFSVLIEQLNSDIKKVNTILEELNEETFKELKYIMIEDML